MARFIDIGANLTDPMYMGLYHGSKKHEPDLLNVLARAWDAGLKKIIITGGNLEDSEKALNLAKTEENLFSTVGCHPTRCQEFETNNTPEQYLSSLERLIKSDEKKIVALGECGLDYDRLHFCPKEVQKKYFEEQLKLSLKLNKPLFLHCRNSSDDFIKIISKYEGIKGVVHSFDGTVSDVDAYVQKGLYIGLNGCSLKTEENLETIKSIPINHLMIETDAPWCEIRPTHAGFKYIKTQYPSVKKEKWKCDAMVKGRNEPCTIRQVIEIIASVREENVDTLANCVYENTNKLFFYN
ncbi:putative deoxyribonuclease TATDN1 [Chrysoperla carnea]|uniref:putative deoxyribonuclease TATDN1 n=1 Tax=Chrysoperla carnea TaxID=189513 RepID=UPI001D07EAB5|nr:putative deoxyribonuclease TATDN1 [Chrysoperla carnea]